MSLILDALKKLDREKAAKRQGTMNIAAAILMNDGTRRRRILVPVAAVLFAAAAVAAVTYYWAETTAQKSAAVQAAPAVEAPPAPQPVPAVVKQQRAEGDPEPAAEPQRKQIATPGPPAAESARPAERPRARAPAVTEPVKVTETGVGASNAGRPKLKVSGIVWQEERSARRAFVNDVPVREGDTVQGAKVAEIHPQHVRFSQGDRVFDVRLFE